MSGPSNDQPEQYVRRLLAQASAAHQEAVRTRDRLRVAWAALAAQQKRAADDWAEADRFFTEQTAALDARAAELDRREKALADARVHAEAAAAGLSEEAVALERRIQNARATLAELERRRDRVRAELPPWEGGLPEGEAFAEPCPDAEREDADLGDRRRVLAEQLSLLADARAQWQRTERQTVVEMEELARELWQREQELDARERRLIRADIRRREEAYDLWQLRLKLEAWQGKLTAAEVGVQTGPPSADLAALRAEVERLAAVLIDVQLPEALDAEEAQPAPTLAFDPGSRAA
jgi:hypothetical protein